MFLFSQYLNAPVNKYINNIFLKDVISFIGKKYESGKGSSFAKGKRYLKKHIPECKSAHIKNMLKSIPHPIRDKNDDEFVFRFSINSYVKIFAKIVELVSINHVSYTDEIKKEIYSIKTIVLEPKYTYSELLIREPLISLNMVRMHGTTKERRNIAQEIKDGIDRADKKYNI